MSKIKKENIFTDEKYSQFIEDFEDKWLQYASIENRIKAYFGTLEKGIRLYKKWEKGEDLFKREKFKLWSKK